MRVYKLPKNKRYPSVTTIVSFAKKSNYGLQRWKAMNYNWRDLLDYAALRGTMVHIQAANRLEELGARSNAVQETIDSQRLAKVCQKLDRPVQQLLDDVEMGMLFFTMFLEDHKIEPVMSEVVVWSDKYKYAGQVDQVMFIDGELTIIDIKTAKKVYPDSGYDVQLAAYAQALFERTGNEKYLTCKRAILLLSPDVEITKRMNYKLVYLPDSWHKFKNILDAFYRADLNLSDASVRDFSDQPDKL